MKRFLGNPWFLAVAGAAALALYAWAETPLAMVVLGLPFYVVVVGPLMLARYLPAGARRQPMGGGNNRLVSVTTGVLVVIGLAYVFWGRVFDSGLVGWLDAVQARAHGTYDLKFSLLVACLYVFVVIGAVVWLLSRLVPGRAAAPAVARANVDPRQAKARQLRIVVMVLLGAAVAVWPIGFGAYEYYADQNRREMQATYQPVDPSVSSAALGQPAYVSLRARVHRAGYVVVHGKQDTDGVMFVPLVTPPGKDRDAPVHWVLQMTGSTLPLLPASVLAHARGGTLSQTTRETFDHMGVRLADDAVLVAYVPTDGQGVVIDRSESYWETFLIGAGLLSAITVVLGVMVWAMQLVSGRRSARVAQR